MALSDRHTIRRLMLCSREFYHEGPKHLLKFPVKLKREAKLRSFLLFMGADGGSRFQYLHHLHLSISRLSKSGAHLLERFLLTSADTLQITHLTIKHAESLFRSRRGLATAFSALHTVTDLSMTEAGRCASTFLENFRSRLVSADLTMIPRRIRPDSISSAGDSDEDDDDDDNDSSIRNPILQLHNSQETLQSLDVQWCDTYCELGEVYEQRYPNVKHLTLLANELPETAHYARAFPNLETLRLESAERELEDFKPTIDRLVDHRHMNKLEQMVVGKWARLKLVHGSLIDHFLLGALCPVEQVHIVGPFMDLRMFRSMLLTTRPAYVNFEGFDVDLFFDNDFKRLTRGNFVSSVRCFEIQIFFGGMLPPSDVDVPKALDILIEGIKQMSSLRSLGVTLCCVALNPVLEGLERLFSSSGPLPLCPAEEYLRDLDLKAFAQRIRDEVPSLESVAVTLYGHRQRKNGFVALGPDVAYEPGAVEAIPMRQGSQISQLFKPNFLKAILSLI